jgi:cytochrome c biogenesis protein CcmG, thiol:disulfide interchange protein DsbE
VKQPLDKLLLGAIVLLTAGLVWIVSGTLEPKITNAGDTAPDFTVTTDAGKTITRDNFGGKLLLLNFWASWCGPCVEEAPSLEAFARQFQSDGVVVLGVSIDRNEKLYRRFIQRFDVTFPVARDPEANISASYGTFQIPETYLIDRNGKVLEKVISNQNWMDPDFVARVRKML